MLNIDVFVDRRNYDTVVGHISAKILPVGLSNFLDDRMAPYLKRRIAARFAAEGDAASGKWMPLRTATQNIRRSKGFGPAHPINDRTGEMRRFFQGQMQLSSPVASGATLLMPGSNPAGELGEKIKTAQIGKASPKTVARPVLAMNTEDADFAISELAVWIFS